MKELNELDELDGTYNGKKWKEENKRNKWIGLIMD